METITSITNVQRPGEVALLQQAWQQYAAASAADNTQRAYRGDWRRFVAWCEARRTPYLPAASTAVANYLAGLADGGKKAVTIDRARAAIRKAHELAGQQDPTHAAPVREALKGIRRTLGTAQQGKAPVLSADITAMVDALPDTLLGLRDRALLLVGFAGGFRRSELAGIAVEHLTETAEGLTILLPRSKTDQEGQGRLVAILRGQHPASCPVRALRAWQEAAGITSGPVFRRVDRHERVLGAISGQAVALVVKRTAAAAQLDPAQYAGHSLRAGLVTQAAKNKASVADIMRQTGHRSTETVNRYVRKANIFEDNISGMLGL